MVKVDKIKVDLIITRHPALVEVLRELPEFDFTEARVLAHATLEDIEGRVVAGVLPLRLAARVRRYFELSLDIPAELRGAELTAVQVRQHLVGITEFTVINHREQVLVTKIMGDDLSWVGAYVVKADRSALDNLDNLEGIRVKAALVVKHDLFGARLEG